MHVPPLEPRTPADPLGPGRIAVGRKQDASRLLDGRWEYNADHRDYLEAGETEARRLRYLVNLFAKEIVLRNFGGPGDGDVLERMVEVLTYLDKGAKRG